MLIRAISERFWGIFCLISGYVEVKRCRILCINEQSDDFPHDFPCFVHRLYLQRFTFVQMNKMNKMYQILFIIICCFIFLFIGLGQ